MTILVIAEHDHGSIKSATLNTVTAAAQIGGDDQSLDPEAQANLAGEGLKPVGPACGQGHVIAMGGIDAGEGGADAGGGAGHAAKTEKARHGGDEKKDEDPLQHVCLPCCSI